MKAEELMIGDLLIVNRDGLCIKKGTVVRVRRIDADNTFRFGELIGSATCRPLDDTQFDGGIWCDYLDPIPLTPEILEKNGFEMVSKRDDDAGTMEKYFYPRIGYVYRFSNGEWEVDLIGYGRGFSGAAKYRGVIKYIHELKHALQLCGIEKEIIV